MSERSDEFGAFLVGLVVGGLTGAAVALLFAPQSGEETRALVKEKGIELRDKTVKIADEAKVKVGELATEAKAKAGELATDAKARGQQALDGVKKAVAKKPPVTAS